MIKTIPFRQVTQFGCGSYSLANLFNESLFIAKLPHEEGENIADLNCKLECREHELYIDPIFMTSASLRRNNQLHVDDVDLLIISDIPAKEIEEKELVGVFLISFARANGAIHWVVVLSDLKSGRYYIVDSVEPDVIECDLLWLIRNYQIVSVSVFRQREAKSKAECIMLSRSELAHLI